MAETPQERRVPYRSFTPKHVRVLNGRNAEMFIPKIGWVRFHLSRPVPSEAKSFRVTLDRDGRWHVVFAVVPNSIPAPGIGEIVGVDRGVVHVATLSDGTFYDHSRPDLDLSVKRLQRALSRCRKGSNRRAETKRRRAKAQARPADARKDMIETATTDVARRFDVDPIGEPQSHEYDPQREGNGPSTWHEGLISGRAEQVDLE